MNFLGQFVGADLDVTLGPPSLHVKDGSGRQIDAVLPTSGHITYLVRSWARFRST
jgi:hypothetical protein